MNTMHRCLQVGDWIFEIKSVRAVRTKEYGAPYSAAANLQFNGGNIFVDSLMTTSGDEFEREDMAAFKYFCQQMGVKEVHFER